MNIDKFQHESVRIICNKLKDVMISTGARSVSAPQLGYRYRIFAMEPVFYEDFDEEKTDFEQLFLSQPKTDQQLQEQSDAINAYLNQLEFHLNNHIPYKNDLKIIEQQYENINNNNNNGHIINENEIKPMIFINPTWSPLDLDQSIFEMEQNKGNIYKSDDGISGNSLYTTLLFGCNGIRTSCNYEQCLSFPELMVKKQRYNRIRTEFYNENGEKRICYLKSNDSRMFQHECDHLDGRLMIDNVKWNDDSSIIYVDEFLRRQEILKPQIEELISKFGPSQQNELYTMYDPLHPPCDEQLIDILENILQRKEQQQQQIVQQANESKALDI